MKKQSNASEVRNGFSSELVEARQAVSEVKSSTSWKVTAPLRFLGSIKRKVLRSRPIGSLSLRQIVDSNLIDESTYFINPDLLVLRESGKLEQELKDISAGFVKPRFCSIAEWHFYLIGQFEVKAGFGRLLRVNLGEIHLDFEEQRYLQDFPDVAVMVSKGLFADGLSHFFLRGAQEIKQGTRGIPASSVKLIALDEISFVSEQAVPSSKLVIYSHWDEDEEIDEYVISALEALVQLGNDICFVSNVSATKEIEKISHLVQIFLRKNNSGRDFGSWALAIKQIGIDQLLKYETVTLTNDSIYFPVFDPYDLFTIMESKELDIWGLTDSFEGFYHIQSFFLVFNQKSMELLFPWILETVETTPNMSRTGIIFTLELGLTLKARSFGLSVGATFSIEDFRDKTWHDPALIEWSWLNTKGIAQINPTHFLWDASILTGRNPSIKRDLLLQNPNKLDISNWDQFVRSDYLDSDAVTRHLKKLRKNRNQKKLPTISLEPFVEEPSGRTVFGKMNKTSSSLVIYCVNEHWQLNLDYVNFALDELHKTNSDVVVVTYKQNLEEFRDTSNPGLIYSSTPIRGIFDSLDILGSTNLETLLAYESIVILSNDHFFPLIDLSSFLENVRRGSPAIWGEINSALNPKQVGGAIVGFEHQAIQSGLLHEVIASITTRMDKHEIYRLVSGLIQTKSSETKLSANVFTSFDISKYQLSSTEISESVKFFWSEKYAAKLIENNRLIGIPIELIRYNQNGLDVPKIITQISKHSKYPVQLIINSIVELSRFPN